MNKIDADRGYIARVHPTGMYVYMYRDKPGYYYDGHGREVGEELAKASGFDIVKHGKSRNLQERKRAAMDAIERELAPENIKEEKVVHTKKGYTVVDIGLGRCNLKDPDGNILNPYPLTLEQVTVLLNQMVPSDPPKAKGKPKADKDAAKTDGGS